MAALARAVPTVSAAPSAVHHAAASGPRASDGPLGREAGAARAARALSIGLWGSRDDDEAGWFSRDDDESTGLWPSRDDDDDAAEPIDQALIGLSDDLLVSMGVDVSPKPPPLPPSPPPPWPPPSPPPTPPLPPDLPIMIKADRGVYFFLLVIVCVVNTLFASITVYQRLLTCARGGAYLTTSCGPNPPSDRRADRGGFARVPSADGSPRSNTHGPIAVLVPCYLPNEQRIIMGTVRHILTKLEYPAPLTLHLVYNTPTALPIEAELLDLERHSFPGGRRVRVRRHELSSSKAENLNMVLEDLDEQYVAIYDADHHPDPNSLLMMVDTARRTGCDAVQGSIYVRSAGGRSACSLHALLEQFINAEFFVQHFLYFPLIEALSFTGFFGGSNALWRTAVLQGYHFRKSMQTEDIDVSCRAILNNHNIVFCPQARSGELAPPTFLSLYRQRLRWAIGWDEVTLACLKLLARSKLSARRKWGLLFMFPTRWLILFLSFFIGVFSPILSVFCEITGWGEAYSFGLSYALFTWVVMILAALTAALQFQTAAQLPWVLVFYCVAPLYCVWTTTLVLISAVKIASGRVGAWHVTERPMPHTDSFLVLNRLASFRFNQPHVDEGPHVREPLPPDLRSFSSQELAKLGRQRASPGASPLSNKSSPGLATLL